METDNYVGKYYDYSKDFVYQSYNERFEAIQESIKNTKELISEDTIPEKYFVYVYLDPRNKGEYRYGNFVFEYAPFYVGKGTGDRLYAHLYYSKKKIKSIKHFVIEQIKIKTKRLPIIIKVLDNVTEEAAFEVENYLINSIGRICNTTGILTNKVSGHKTEWEHFVNKHKKV